MKFDSKSTRIIRRSSFLLPPSRKTSNDQTSTESHSSSNDQTSTESHSSSNDQTSTESHSSSTVWSYNSSWSCGSSGWSQVTCRGLTATAVDDVTGNGDFPGPVISCPHCRKDILITERALSDEGRTSSLCSDMLTDNFIESQTQEHVSDDDVTQRTGQMKEPPQLSRENQNCAQFPLALSSHGSSKNKETNLPEVDELANTYDDLITPRHGVKRKRSDDDCLLNYISPNHRNGYKLLKSGKDRDRSIETRSQCSVCSLKEPSRRSLEYVNTPKPYTGMEDTDIYEKSTVTENEYGGCHSNQMDSGTFLDSKKSFGTRSDETMASANSYENYDEDCSSSSDSDDSFMTQIDIDISWNQDTSIIEIENRIASVTKILFHGNDETDATGIAPSGEENLVLLENGDSYSGESIEMVSKFPSPVSQGAPPLQEEPIEDRERFKSEPNKKEQVQDNSEELNPSMQFLAEYLTVRPMAFSCTEKPMNPTISETPADSGKVAGITCASAITPNMENESNDKCAQELLENSTEVRPEDDSCNDDYEDDDSSNEDDYEDDDSSNEDDNEDDDSSNEDDYEDDDSCYEDDCEDNAMVSDSSEDSDLSYERQECLDPEQEIDLKTDPTSIATSPSSKFSTSEVSLENMRGYLGLCLYLGVTFQEQDSVSLGCIDHDSNENVSSFNQDCSQEVHTTPDLQFNLPAATAVQGDTSEVIDSGSSVSKVTFCLPQNDSAVSNGPKSRTTEHTEVDTDGSNVRPASNPGLTRSFLNFLQSNKKNPLRSKRGLSVRRKSKTVKIRRLRDRGGCSPTTTGRSVSGIATTANANDSKISRTSESKIWQNPKFRFMNIWRSFSDPAFQADETSSADLQDSSGKDGNQDE